jgi:hypothetical protein
VGGGKWTFPSNLVSGRKRSREQGVYLRGVVFPVPTSEHPGAPGGERVPKNIPSSLAFHPASLFQPFLELFWVHPGPLVSLLSASFFEILIDMCVCV